MRQPTNRSGHEQLLAPLWVCAAIRGARSRGSSPRGGRAAIVVVRPGPTAVSRGFAHRGMHKPRATPTDSRPRGLTLPVRIIYDATHILQVGTSPPVGITRVEHYVVEYLLTKAADPVLFVCFDRAMDRYRRTTGTEDAWIRQHVLCRYDVGGAVPVVNDPERARGARLLGKLAKYGAQDAGKFAAGLSYLFETRLAVPTAYPAPLRVLLRIARAVGFATVRMVHLAIRFPVRAGGLIARPGAREGRRKDPREFDWQQNDSLVVLANLWDYMNYDYFRTLQAVHNLNITTVVYDVIALVYPYTTPEPTALYHRHWVNIAHTCRHIIAISHHTAATYDKYILGPNDIKAKVSVATLPNFLKDRAGDIGIEPVAELAGSRFVMYCSTIETRKNHETLIHVWERLTDDLDPDQLPVLVFVGRWGWGFEAVRRMYDRCWRLRPRLLILEHVADDQLIWLYRNAVFTVFPSLSEGFGLAAAESLSFGTPVIVSNCPALSEATEGLMPAIDPLDVPEWTRQIRRLLLDEQSLTLLHRQAAAFRGAEYDAFARTILRAASGG
jgi:glycosyltransferase involved in cell wall biosynthesis